MHIVKKNSPIQIISENSKSFDFSSEGLDNIFAELFSSVNLSSLETESDFNDLNLASFIDKDDQSSSEFNAAKSLISIFINDKEIEDNLTNKNNGDNIHTKVINQKNDGLIPLNNSLEKLSKAKIDLIFPTENKKQSNIQINELNLNLKKKNFSDVKNIGKNTIKLKSENFKEETLISQKIPLKNKLLEITNPKNKTSLSFEKNKLRKIFSKKLSNFKTIELETKFSENTNKINKTDLILKNSINNVMQHNGVEKASGQNVTSNLQNENISKDIKHSNFKPAAHNTNLSDQKYLDLMESGWGEKFAKNLKVSIQRGVQKLNFDLQPKNLGKLKVEISYEDGKTKIKINTDNKSVANIFNENHARLTELLDKEQIRFDQAGAMTFGKNFNDQNNKDESHKNDQNQGVKKVHNNSEKNNPDSVKEKKNLHEVDIKA